MKRQNILRRISVHVEEPTSGAFEWVLSEAKAMDSDEWSVLKRARTPASTYKASMADGLVALQSLTDNLDIGPRTSAVPVSEPESRPARKRTARSPLSGHQGKAPEKTPARTAFGFGLVK